MLGFRCVKLNIFSLFKIFIKILMKENKEIAPVRVTADVGVVDDRNVEGTIDDSTCSDGSKVDIVVILNWFNQGQLIQN